MTEPRLAFILGSGFVIEGDPIVRDTPYGPHSELRDAPLGDLRGLVLLRHGRDHTVPPHRINHRANLHALASLGVSHVVSLSSAGALDRQLAVGSFAVPLDFVDFTGRVSTFHDDSVRHTSMAEPFDLRLSGLVQRTIGARAPCTLGGVYVGVNGPRYPTRAEIRLYRQVGTMIGMTVVPEVVLAGELGVCYASCILISDAEIDVRHEQVVQAAPQRRAAALAALPELLRAIRSGVEQPVPRRIWRPRFRRWWR
jgi:5'-methylthioadenosine phosphorylase